MRCAVVNCKSNNKNKACKLSFFTFPSDAKVQKKWISFCGRKNKFNVKTSFICMLHFHADDIANNLQYEMGFSEKRLLKSGTVPSINTALKENSKLYEQRAARKERRENKKIVDFLLSDYSSQQCEEVVPIETCWIKTEGVPNGYMEETETYCDNNWVKNEAEIMESSDNINDFNENFDFHVNNGEYYIEAIKLEI